MKEPCFGRYLVLAACILPRASCGPTDQFGHMAFPATDCESAESIVEGPQDAPSTDRVVPPSGGEYEDHLNPPALAMWYNPLASEPFLDPPPTGLLFAIWPDGYVVYDEGNALLTDLWSARGSSELLHRGWADPSLVARCAASISSLFLNPLRACDQWPGPPLGTPETPHARHVTILVRTESGHVEIDFFRRVFSADSSYEECEEVLWHIVDRIQRLFPTQHEEFTGNSYELMGYLGYRIEAPASK